MKHELLPTKPISLLSRLVPTCEVPCLPSPSPSPSARMIERPKLNKPATELDKTKFTGKRKNIHHCPTHPTINAWNVERDDVPNLPLYYVKSPTCTLIRDEGPQDIADRITDVISSSTSVGQYNNRKASAIIYTPNGVEISIQFYKVNAKPAKNNGTCGDSENDGEGLEASRSKAILLECIRIKGDVIEYHHVMKSILDAVNYVVPSLNNKARCVTPNATTLHSHRRRLLSSSMKKNLMIQNESQNEDQTIEDNEEAIFHKLVENIETLLQKDRDCAIELGLQSLVILTSGTSSSDDLSLRLSKIILLGNYDKHDVSRPTIAKLSCSSCCGAYVKEYIFDTISQSVSDEKVQHHEIHTKFLLAVKIFGNSLLNILKTGHNATFLQSHCGDDLKHIFPIMIKVLEQMRTPRNAQIAHQIVRCISHLVEFPNILKNLAIDKDGLERILEDKIGNCDNDLLRKSMEKIVSSLPVRTSSSITYKQQI